MNLHSTTFTGVLVCMLLSISVKSATVDGNSHCTTSDFHGNCYWLESRTRTWADAWMTCVSKEGTLAVLDTQAVNDFLINANIFTQGRKYWIGLTDRVTTGVFRWTNGRAVGSWGKWLDSLPGGRNESACVATTSSAWHSIDCITQHFHLCQSVTDEFYCEADEPSCAPWINIEFDATHTDVGCSATNVEYSINDLDINVTARMCKALCQRSVYVVCLGNEESVGDCRGYGLNFSRMQLSGCIVNMPGTTLYTRTFYSIGPIPETTIQENTFEDVSWKDAALKCIDSKKQLLTFKSPDISTELNGRESWISLTNENSLGAFQWNDGTYQTYENWKEGYPDGGTNRRCTFVDSLGQWTNLECSTPKPYMCEKVVINPGTVIKSSSLFVVTLNGIYSWTAVDEESDDGRSVEVDEVG